MVCGEFSVIRNKFAFVDTETEGIFIPKNGFNGALNGDIVLVRITKESRNSDKKEGEVYKIIKRTNDIVIGILQKQKSFGFCYSNSLFWKDIYIPKKFTNIAR